MYTARTLNLQAWITLSAIALIGVSVYFHYQEELFPSIGTKITMSAQEAKQQAMQKNHNSKLILNPQKAIFISAYQTNQDTNNYITLYAGGNKKLNQLLSNHELISSYWHVRSYIPEQIQENHYYFTPTGENFGFTIVLPEDKVLPNLDKQSAQKLAMDYIKKHPIAGAAIENYKLQDHSEYQQNNGRIDHTFIYENPDAKIEEARHKLEFTVSGNQLTNAQKYIQLPSNFAKKIQSMQAYNSTLFEIAQYFAFAMYGALGIFLFIKGAKQQALDYGSPVFYAIIITILTSLANLNSLDLAQFYNHSSNLPINLWLSSVLINTFLQTIHGGIFLSVLFIIADYANRSAFPHHPNLWNWWKKENALSPGITSQVAFGYGLFCISLGYCALFYLGSQLFPNVWLPSGNFTDPNIISYFFPAFNPLANSLYAGFMEECAFRVIPIASAVIIGRAFHCEKKLLWPVLILQAIIFGGLHANYAQQPSYIRIIELGFEFFFYGLVYYRLGLLPVILAHYLFDLTVMGQSLFFTSTPYIQWQQLSLIICVIAPALVLLTQRLRSKQFFQWQSPKHLLNAHSPIKSLPIQSILPAKVIPTQAYTRYDLQALLLLGGIGVCCYGYVFVHRPAQTTLVKVTEQQALAVAKPIATQLLSPNKPWRISIQAEDKISMPRKYLYDTLGVESTLKILKDGYWTAPNQNKLDLRHHLDQDIWEVSYKNFSEKDDQDQRTEKLTVWINEANTTPQYHLSLSDQHPKTNISKQQALNLAWEFLNGKGVTKNNYKLINYTPTTHSSSKRTDHTFTFKNSITPAEHSLDPRWVIEVSGDKVSSASSYMHATEKWDAQQERQQLLLNILQKPLSLPRYYFGFIGPLILLLLLVPKHYAQTIYAQKNNFLLISGLLIGMQAVSFYSHLPTYSHHLSPHSAVYLQWIEIGIAELFEIIEAPIIALMIVCATQWQTYFTRSSKANTVWIYGLSIGFITFSCLSMVNYIFYPTDISSLFAGYSNAKPIWLTLTLDSIDKFLFTIFNALLAVTAWCTYTLSKKQYPLGITLLLGFCILGTLMLQQTIISVSSLVANLCVITALVAIILHYASKNSAIMTSIILGIHISSWVLYLPNNWSTFGVPILINCLVLLGISYVVNKTLIAKQQVNPQTPLQSSAS